MAPQSELQIKIKAFIEGLDSIKKLGAELVGSAEAQTRNARASASAREEQGKFVKSTKEAADAAKGLNASFKDLSPGLNSLVGYLKGAVLGLVAYAGALKIKDLAETAARTETLGVTLGVVGRTAGYSKDQLAAYEKELVKLGITSQVARDSLTKLIQSGIELSAVNERGVTTAARLARSAQDLAVVTGENSSDTLQRLITNISQMDTVGLRYQGIVVNTEAAQAKFAQSIGKSVEQLTQQQKVQAFLNETLIQADKLQGAYAESMDTAGKKAASLTRYQQELANALGEKLLPAYGALVDVTTDFLKNTTKIATETDKTGELAKRLGDSVKFVFKGVTDLVEALFRAFSNAAPEITLVAEQIAGLLRPIFDVITALVQWADEIGLVKFAFYTIGLTIAGLRDGIYALSGIFSGFISLVLYGVGQIITDAAKLAGIFSEDIKNSLDEVAAGVNKYAEEYGKYAGKVGKDFLDGNTEVQRYIQGLDEATRKTEAFGKATDFKSAQEEIRKLTEAVRTNTITSQEATGAADRIRTKIKELGDQHKVTADQVAILSSQLATATSKIDQDYQQALGDLGITFSVLANSSAKFAQQTGGDMGKISGALLILAQNARTLEGQFSQAFSRGLNSAKTLEDLTKLSQAITEAGKNSQLVNDAGEAASLAALKFEDLFQAELKAANTQQDFAKIRVELEALRAAGVISEQTLITSFSRLEEAAQRFSQEVNNADIAGPLRNLGTSLDQVRTGISESTRNIVQQLEQVRGSAKLTATEFRKLFSESLSAAQSTADLREFQQELEKARRSGQLFGQEYEAAVSKLAQAFDKLFQAELAAATTAAEFEELRDRVQELGEKGVISGAQVTQAMDDIRERATGARESVLRLSEQMVELAEANTSAVEAFADITRASIDVQNAKNDLLQAEANFRAEGTKAAKAEVDAQKEVVRAVEEKARLTQAKYQEELAQMELVRLKQIQINAEKAKELDPTNAINIQAAASAKDQADKQQLVVDRAKVAVQQQTQVVAQTQAAAAAAQNLARNMANAAANANQTAGAVNRIGQAATFTGTTIAAWDTGTIANNFRQMGLSLQEANSQAAALVGRGQAVVAFGAQGVEAYAKIAEKVAEVGARVREQQEASQRLISTYEAIKRNAEGIALGLITTTEATRSLEGALQQTARAMEQIRNDARQTAAAAADAARGFLSTTQSIQEELLNVQGREEEASRLRFETRRRELALEYELLKVKIQAAIVTARAAGLTEEISALQKLLGLADANYKNALGALNQLETLEIEKIRLRKEEENRRRQEEQQRRVEEARQETEDERRRQQEGGEDNGRNRNPRDNALLDTLNESGRNNGANNRLNQFLQSIANGQNPIGGPAGTTINVNLTNTSFGDPKTLAELIGREVVKVTRTIGGRSA